MSHCFINEFEFAGEQYRATAYVYEGDSPTILGVEPRPHPDLEDAISGYLRDWIWEITMCHRELDKGVM